MSLLAIIPEPGACFWDKKGAYILYSINKLSKCFDVQSMTNSCTVPLVSH